MFWGKGGVLFGGKKGLQMASMMMEGPRDRAGGGVTRPKPAGSARCGAVPWKVRGPPGEKRNALLLPPAAFDCCMAFSAKSTAHANGLALHDQHFCIENFLAQDYQQ
jgi:hypothetical protein